MSARGLSRREFLLALGGAGTVVALGAGANCGAAQPPVVGITASGLLIGGKTVPLYSAGLDYWSYDPSLWDTLLERLSRIGINTVGVSVPWSEHELAPGQYDFGALEARRNVIRFIELVAGRQLNVLLRLGPLLPSLAGCGIPARLLFDQRVAARTARDTVAVAHTPDGQYPQPSLNSAALLRELTLWLDQLALRLTPTLHPGGGPVVAVMLESALSFFGSLDYPYSTDYHPDTLALYRSRLAEQYESIDSLNRVYGAAYQSFEQVEPPREFMARRLDNLPAYLEWVAFRRWADNHALDRVAQMLAARGITGVPVIRKAPAPLSGGPGQQSARGPSVIPADNPRTRMKYVARVSAGSCDYPLGSALTGGEAFPALEGIASSAENEFVAMMALMYGVKGLDSRSMVESNGWLVAPVRADGRVRSDYFNACRRVCRFLRESHFEQFTRKVEAVVLNSRALDTMLAAAGEASAACPPLSPEAAFIRLSEMGGKTSVHACRLWSAQVEGLLADTGFDWNRATAGAAADRLMRYKVAVLPSVDFIFSDEAAWLSEFVNCGGTLVYGPGRPALNERMEPDPRVDALFSTAAERAGRAGGVPGDSLQAGQALPRERVVRLESPLKIGDLLKELEVALPFTRTNPRVELSVHTHSSGRMLLFAANSTGRAQRTDIFFQGRFDFRDVLEHSTFSGEGKIRIEIPARRVQVWEVSA